jgi:phosphate transport system substrate-binding protein
MKKGLGFAVILLITLGNPIWSGGQETPSAKRPAVKGGGATFPAPLYQVAIADFETQYPNLEKQILYNQKLPDRKPWLLGSDKGRKLVRGKGLDFAGTDWPLTRSELSRIQAIQIPTVVGAVTIVYNLPGLTGPDVVNRKTPPPRLTISADILARIFQGTITRWDDGFIQRENPDIILPSADIIPVHRSDGSGTTHMLANYLSMNAKSWTGGNDFKLKKLAKASIAAKGNDALAETISETAYSIGYVELEYAVRKQLVTARLQITRKDKTEFAEPSVSAIDAAVPKEAAQVLANDAGDEPELRVQQEFPKIEDVADPNQPSPYLISGFTWLILKPLSGSSQEVLCKFLEFLPGWSRAHAGTYGYAPLPEEIVAGNSKKISEICPATASSSGSKPDAEFTLKLRDPLMIGRTIGLNGVARTLGPPQFAKDPSEAVRVEICCTFMSIYHKRRLRQNAEDGHQASNRYAKINTLRNLDLLEFTRLRAMLCSF